MTPEDFEFMDDMLKETRSIYNYKIDNMKLKVKIKKHEQYAATPYKTYERDFCYDVIAISEEEVAPNVWKYGLGLSFQIDKESVNGIYSDSVIFSIDFRSRSSIWKTGMVLSNSVGTIDEIFTGEVSAVFYHVMPNMPRYGVGDRIGQIKIGKTVSVDFEKVEELSETERGQGGYGSTGA